MAIENGTSTFDLTERPWIPVRRRDGSEAELSLREVFEQAHDGPDGVRRIVGDLPTQEFALVRLLLAVLHDALDGPEDVEQWKELWDGKRLPAELVRDYLRLHQDRFDLLHGTAPFLQVADLRTAKSEYFSLDRIVADVPNGERFFTMRARGAQRLSFAEAARWLVHAHAFDPSGIKSGAVGDRRVKNGKGYPQGVAWAGNLGGVLLEGEDLRQTLLLNLIAFDFDIRTDEGDRPAWRFDPVGPGALRGAEGVYRPYGLRDLYTWQSRRVRLFADGEGVYGVLLCYGDPLEAPNQHSREPMTGWRRSPNQEKKLGKNPVYMPAEHDPSRSAWRGLESLIQGEADTQRGEAAKRLRPRVMDWADRLVVRGVLPEDKLVTARTVGARYGTQQSVIDEVTEDRVNMRLALLADTGVELRQAAVAAVADADKAVFALGNLASGIARAAGLDPEAPRQQARDRAFGELDAAFRRWLEDLAPGQDPDERRQVWQWKVRRLVDGIGRELVTNAGEAAWTGRVIEMEKGDQLWLTAGQAERRFRSDLNKALRMTVHQATSENDT
ncbi:type I-E CRISPR-associated protein Cse1/CasA [Marinactinospora rubrisoli]|uniref:Type I-E CRISPR-associated protein Cse1/CasA n=1 Tax=Marinactinospora rubrisoli TaxID=2715399 RepID=A0ABW2KB26_9ACTN